MSLPLRYMLALLLLLSNHQLYARDIPNNSPLTTSGSSSFRENNGQLKDQFNHTRNDIDFSVASPGMCVFIGKGQIHYQFNKCASPKHFDPSLSQIKPAYVGDVTSYRVDVTLIGANVDAQVSTLEKQAFVSNNYTNGKHNKSDNYKVIVYKNIYPNIDWEIYFAGTRFKYDFIVHEGGNAADIQLKIDGATQLGVGPDGGLAVSTPFGNIEEQRPYSYQESDKKIVPSSFSLHDNIVRFQMAPYNGTLVIDPTVIWATYYGGADIDEVYKLRNDAEGNVFITGVTLSSSNIATTGSFLNTYHGGYDAFVAKFNKTGGLEWSTYFGDVGDEYAMSLALDNSGDILVTGATNSDMNIAVSGSHQPAYGGDATSTAGDAFVIKFDASGQRLWSTYFGGANSESGYAVVTDDNDNVYIGGITTSSNNIATAGSFKQFLSAPPLGPPPPDAFLAKFTTDGVLVWGTYYGGNAPDLINCLGFDKLGDLYVGGETVSQNIGTSGTYQPNFAGGSSDAFISRFSVGGSPSWCTYVGGSSYEHATDLFVDKEHNVYFSGSTYGDNSIATLHGNQTTFSGGGGDGFLTKFSISGQIVWGTYFGGTGFDQINGMAVDSLGNIVIAGFTSSADNINQTPGTGKHQFLINGNSAEGFIAKFNAIGQRLWSSYFSGVGKAVGCYGKGHIYFTGYTTVSGLATSGAYQTTNNGSGDVILARLEEDTTVSIKQPFTDTAFCAGASFRLPYFVNNKFRPGNTFTAQLSDAFGSFAAAIAIGHVTSSVDGQIMCLLPQGISGANYRVRIISTAPVDTCVDNGINISIITGPLSSPGVTVTSMPANPLPGQTTIYTANVSNGGAAINYQWYINGAVVPGATANPFTTALNYGDQVFVVVFCHLPCGANDSAISTTSTLGIGNEPLFPRLSVYPNPNTGDFNISGLLEGKVLDLEVMNAVGQVIFQDKIPVDNGKVNKHISLGNIAAGMYLLKLNDGVQTATRKLTVR